ALPRISPGQHAESQDLDASLKPSLPPQLQDFLKTIYNRSMSHALVLNASFEPLHIVTWQRAMQLLFQGKVEVVEESDREIRTVRFTMKIPAVLRLLTYVPLKNKKQIVRFSRANIFARDQNICQYCGQKFNK